MPHNKERLEYQECNANLCPDELKCGAALDLLVLLDGGGSLMYKESFEAQVNVSKLLVENSTLDQTGADEPLKTMRLGFVVYSDEHKILSRLSGTKDDLVKALDEATWPAKGANVGPALLMAQKLLQFEPRGTNSRLQTVLFFTDGSPSRVSEAEEMAKQLRNSGIRLVVALVNEEIRGVTRFKVENNACKIASQPCRDNLLVFSSWHNVEAEARRLMVALCPVIENPMFADLS